MSANESKRATKVCFHCRNRKVRCEWAPEGCENCQRLQFDCSFAVPAQRSEQDQYQLEEPNSQRKDLYTSPSRYGGIEKKRTRRACLRCQAQKTKCSGEFPACRRCDTKGFDCRYALDPAFTTGARETRVQRRGQSRLFTAEDSILNNAVAAAEESEASGAVAFDSWTSMCPHFQRDIGPERAIMRQHLDAFFENIYPMPCLSFLHRSTLLQNWSDGKGDPNLLRAICGASARYVSTNPDHQREAASWIDQAEDQILRDVGEPSLAHIETLAVLVFARTTSRKFGRVMALSALLSRFAIAMRLNYEDKRLQFLAQERRRRLMWSIFVTDTFLANGRTEFTLCSADSIYLQLPCHERSFALEIAVETEPLKPPRDCKNQINMGTMAYLIRVLEIRVRIQRLTHFMVDRKEISQDSYLELKALESELETFHELLPSSYRYNERNLHFRAYDAQRTGFVMLHIWWHMCYCDLYRFTIPKFREALPDTVLDGLSPSFVTDCREKCLSHACAIVDLFMDVRKLGRKLFVTDVALAICSLQCARIIVCLGEAVAVPLQKSGILVRIEACYDILEDVAELYPTSKLLRDSIFELMLKVEQNLTQSRPACDIEPPENSELPPSSATERGLSVPTRHVYTKHSFLEEIRNMAFHVSEEDKTEGYDRAEYSLDTQFSAKEPVVLEVHEARPGMISAFSSLEATAIKDNILTKEDQYLPWLGESDQLDGNGLYDLLLDPVFLMNDQHGLDFEC